MRLLIILLTLTLPFKAMTEEVPISAFATQPSFIKTKISPDGKHLAFTYKNEGTFNVGILNSKTNKGTYSFTMGPGREAVDFWWVNSNRIAVLSQRITGWLDGKSKSPNLYAVDLDGKNKKLLWDFQRAYIRPISLLREEPNHVLITKHNMADGFSAKIHKLNIVNGKMRYMPDTPKKQGGKDSEIVSISVDTNDVPRVALENDPVDENDYNDDIYYIHLKNKKNDWEVLTLPTKKSNPSILPLGFNLDNTKFYFQSNHDLEDDGNTGLFEFDLKAKKINFLFRHEDVDIKSSILGSNGEVIGVTYESGYPAYFYMKDDLAQPEIQIHKQLRAQFKGQEVSIENFTEDKQTAMIRVYSDKNPGSYYLFNKKQKNLKFVANSRPEINPEQMSRVEPFTITARDGLKLYGLMTIPSGRELKNLPLVIYPHGGPYGVYDEWRWDNRAQLFASRGYLVMQLNFRGSGGFGKKFMESGHSEWGVKMQDDLTDATLWAIEQGYADADRVCIHGVSYGGYAAMNAVVREPDLYKCAIPDAGIYEVELQWKKADSFKGNPKARKKYFITMFGTDTDKSIIDSRSPALHVDKVKANLLLVHGTEDKRVPVDNAYFLEEQLKKANKPYETLYRKDGHGFQKVKYREELFKKMLEFLDKNIGS